jgi:hypothetical protein
VLSARWFTFVLTLLEPDFELPVELAPGVYLEHASDQQRNRITEFFRHQGYEEYLHLYSTKPVRKAGGIDHYLPVTPEEDTFYVVSFDSEAYEERWKPFSSVFNATLPELSFAWLFKHTFYVRLAPQGLGSFFEYLMWKDPVVTRLRLSIEDLDRIRTDFELFSRLPEEHSWVSASLELLADLNRVPRGHALYTLGLFAVLESLILHRPGDRETGDSLIRQLWTKMQLLERRVPYVADRSHFDPQLSGRRLWEKLYAIRSNLAHGQSPDFGTTFASLKGLSHVEEFLRESVRSTLRLALREPDLVRDLKNC